MTQKTEYKHDELIHSSEHFQFIMNHSTGCIDVREAMENGKGWRLAGEIDEDEEFVAMHFTFMTAEKLIDLGTAMKQIFKPETQA